MSNLLQRIIMFVFFIPALVALVVLVPQSNHLALQVVVLVVTAGLALETARICNQWPWTDPSGAGRRPFGPRLWRTLAILACGLSFPIGRSLAGFGLVPATLLPLFVMVPLAGVFLSQVVQSQRVPLELFSRSTASYLLVLAYPALGMGHLIAIMFLPEATALLLVCLGAVFLNDTAAYVAGRLFGKNSPKPVRVSPNKTRVGFVVGFLFSPAIVLLGWFVRPDIFPAGPLAALGLGILVGIFTIAGDLFESGLKRSHGMKDSGTVILGRGGLLDSLDSLILSAPVFYYAYALLNGVALT